MNENYTRYNRGVKSYIVKQLLDLNRRFYAEHGHEFSATRRRLQPGVMRVIESLGGHESILDLGCGNGELARTLSRRGHQGSYLGLDLSLPLLQEADREAFAFPVQFRQVDLTSSDWNDVTARVARKDLYDIVFAFAFLHHIPGNELRLKVIGKVHESLKPKGLFVHSNWQFLNSGKLKARIQAWESIGLGETDADAKDYLIDWRGGGYGLRYVHHFDESELSGLAKAGNFEIIQTFCSDGDNKRLSIYQTWRAI
jgi:tRNA (uracil-5-)-methyltransferase TRM9